jgi:hypothetical protein
MKYPTIDVTTTSKDRTALAKPGLGASVKAEKNNTLPTYNKIANEMSHPYPVTKHHEILCERMAWLLRFNRKNRCNDRIRKEATTVTMI